MKKWNKYLLNNEEVKILAYFKEIKNSSDPLSHKRKKLYYQQQFSDEELIKSLVDRGYLSTRNSNGGTNTAITSQGEKYLEKCYQHKNLGILSKFTIVFKKNYSAILSLITMLISIIALSTSVLSCEKTNNNLTLNSSQHEVH